MHDPHFGALAFVDVSDTACMDVGGGAIQVTPALPDSSPFDRLGTLTGAAGRRFATSSEGLELFTFDADGSNPSMGATGPATGASQGPTIAALLLQPKGGIAFQQFDASGAAQGKGQALLSLAPDSFTVAAAPAQGLAVWTAGGTMAGRFFGLDGSLGASVDLGSDTAGVTTSSTNLIAARDTFVVVWTRLRTDGQFETLWRSIDATGTPSNPRTVLLSAEPHGATALAARPGGSAVLLDAGASAVAVVLLDAQGQMVGPGYWLSGAQYGLGLAANASSFAVVASKDNRSALRVLGLDGTPLGPWRCLDHPDDGGSTITPGAAVDVDGTGYATLTHVSNGSSIFLREDSNGAGL
jgi:hypothetical protein